MVESSKINTSYKKIVAFIVKTDSPFLYDFKVEIMDSRFLYS